MKKILFLIVVIITTIFLFYSKSIVIDDEETRGVFISYLEYEKYLKGKDSKEIDKEIKKIVYSLDKYYINTIYLQTRISSDSIYNSKIFPFTDKIANYQGEDIGIDVLDTFIKYSKKRNIKVYAWINPYRVSTTTDVSKISKSNPVYKYLNTNHVHIIEDKGIYYNPASRVVKNLIVSGVVEIVNNYDIDGIIFDDYFYPNETIDLENYKEVENTISIEDFRLSQVNELIKETYKTIKRINSNLEFGISPDGNINNNYELYYADVKRWLKEDNYIDFIIPQIYYGFDHEITPFIKTVNEWNNLIQNNTKLIVGLALYKSGKEDYYAKSGSDEWLKNNKIITREIEVSRNMSNYKGYALYRYDYLINNQNEILDSEVVNYVKFMSNCKNRY